MTMEGDGSYCKKLREDVLNTLNAILPKAVTEVLNETIANYKKNMNFEKIEETKKTYATATKQGPTDPHIINRNMQRFNNTHAPYMNMMLRKREDALFKMKRCENLTTLYNLSLIHI